MKKINTLSFWIGLGIVALAIFLRLSWLDNTPPGLHPIEAEFGLKALEEPFSFSNGNLFSVITKGFIHFFGPTILSLRLAAGLIGILTILGLYLLVSRLFNWKIAALSAFVLSTSFWHIYYSRIGLEIITVPLIIVWSIYFLWRGLKTGSSWSALIGGVIAGLGAYTHLSFASSIIIYFAIILNFFSVTSKDYIESEYRHGVALLTKTVAIFSISAILVAAPIVISYLLNSDSLLSSASLSYRDTLNNFRSSIYLLFGPIVISWPLAALSMLGLVRETIHWRNKKHGHYSTTHTLILSWLVAGLVPGLFAQNSPDTILTLSTIIPLSILAGQALWWIGQKLEAWDELAAPSMRFRHSATTSATIAVIALVVAVGTVETNKYKKLFEGSTSDFSRYTEIAERINKMPEETNKYVLVNTEDSKVQDIVKYLTNTGSIEKQNERRVWYISEKDFKSGKYNKQSVIIPLK